jgi:pyrimidine deaminase RibD-like protein
MQHSTDKLIDQILIKLFNDDDFKIDFPILKAQLEEHFNLKIDDTLKKIVLDTLIKEGLCSKTYFNNHEVLELTSKGKEILREYNFYTNYIESKTSKKEEDVQKHTQNQKLKMEIGKETINKLMRLAIDNAKKSVSEDGKLSPKVGAAIFKDGQILGSAFRGQLGEGDHAEFTLFQKILEGQDVSGAILFTTLEPCTHRNNHKPCSDWIIEKGIKHVFIGCLDPNPKIYNNGCKKLREAGVEVSYFDAELREEIMNDNIKFIDQFKANPELEGEVSFDYTSNENNFTIGNNEFAFQTKWTKGDSTSINVYNSKHGATSVKTVAIADGLNEITEVKDGGVFDSSTSYRLPKKGQIVILQNITGFYAAIKILDIKDDRTDGINELKFKYKILKNKSADFTNI